MQINREKLDEIVLALLWFNRFQHGPNIRAWKSFDWDTMDRLFEKDYISDPKNKAKSVVLFEESLERAEALFEKHFGLEE